MSVLTYKKPMTMDPILRTAHCHSKRVSGEVANYIKSCTVPNVTRIGECYVILELHKNGRTRLLKLKLFLLLFHAIVQEML